MPGLIPFFLMVAEVELRFRENMLNRKGVGAVVVYAVTTIP